MDVGGDGWKISGGKRLKEVDAVFSIINIIRTKPYKTVFITFKLVSPFSSKDKVPLGHKSYVIYIYL